MNASKGESKPRSTAIAAVLVSALYAVFGGPAALAMDYPGTPPGRGIIDCADRAVVLKNAVLSMRWAWDENGIRLAGLRDEQTKQEIALKGEAFQIVMADGQRHAASTSGPREPRPS